MKFFDIEMESYLMAKYAKKKGGRDIVYSGGGESYCSVILYHGGTNGRECGISKYTKSQDCEVNTFVDF